VGLIFVNLGVLLPGLLSSLGWQQGNPRERYVEFGPEAVPLISEPAPPQQESPTKRPDPPTVVRPRMWKHLAGSVTVQLTAPSNGGRR
jgi:hypothetical protein